MMTQRLLWPLEKAKASDTNFEARLNGSAVLAAKKQNRLTPTGKLLFTLARLVAQLVYRRLSEMLMGKRAADEVDQGS